MQSKMFVFIGLSDNFSDTDLNQLLESLNKRFSEDKSFLQFTRKDELLLAEVDDVSFYISFLKSEDEMEDWIQMANDFELSVDLNKINEKKLTERYKNLKKSFSDLYEDYHYDLAKIIFKEINVFPEMSIYSFQ